MNMAKKKLKNELSLASVGRLVASTGRPTATPTSRPTAPQLVVQ